VIRSSSLLPLLFGLALAAAAPAGDLGPLARIFAPVIHQDTANDQDYITAFDFDGDWNGGNNWENQDDFPLRAVVYWAGLETATHVYLTYAWFHPRDHAKHQRWGSLIGRSGAHENDLEGAWLVLRKREGRVWPVLLETIFHSHFRKYVLDPTLTPRTGIEFEETRVRFEGLHPVVEVESHGHGVTAWDGDDFPGGDGVIYRVGDVAEEPEHDDDRDVSYRLVPIEESLWTRRFSLGEEGTFAKADDFGEMRYGYAFRGYDYGKHKAHAPWGWTDASTDLPRGTHFFDPARWLLAHVHPPGPVAVRVPDHPFRETPEEVFGPVYEARMESSETLVSAVGEGPGLLGN